MAGATGNVGRELVARLAAEGRRVRALTRDPSRAVPPEGVEVVGGDLTRPDGLAAAFDGVTALHLITLSGEEGTPLRTGPEIAALAERSGVERVTVLWSGFSGGVEAAVEASGMEWTMLQPQEFMSNALTWADSVRRDGTVREAFPEVRSAVIDEADIAAVAAKALTEPGHHGRRYTMTGPEPLTVPDRVRILSEAVGRPIRFVELDRGQALRRLLDEGVDRENAEFVVGWHADPPPEAYTVSPTVARVTGRPANRFADWAARHAAAFTG
ncbi:NAD(P)H-binding protein [Stackebrandtia albiflava]